MDRIELGDFVSKISILVLRQDDCIASRRSVTSSFESHTPPRFFTLSPHAILRIRQPALKPAAVDLPWRGTGFAGPRPTCDPPRLRGEPGRHPRLGEAAFARGSRTHRAPSPATRHPLFADTRRAVSPLARSPPAPVPQPGHSPPFTCRHARLGAVRSPCSDER